MREEIAKNEQQNFVVRKFGKGRSKPILDFDDELFMEIF